MSFNRIAVIGAGQMGNGIAQTFAQAEYDVVLCDKNSEALEKGLLTIKKNLANQVKKERLTQVQVYAIEARIITCTELVEVADCDLVIEAIIENETIKQSLFKQLDETCQPNCILASNTSSISISKLAAATKRPSQVIGMHFMNPVPVMKLVEIIPALQTGDKIFAAIGKLAADIGKSPVSVKDAPGFAANRILIPMLNEAMFCVYEGIANAEEIDTISQLGMSHKMGPLALADLIGLDTCLSIMEVLYDGFKDSKYRPCPLLSQMVNAGYLGRKSGRGFYDYSTGA